MYECFHCVNCGARITYEIPIPSDDEAESESMENERKWGE